MKLLKRFMLFIQGFFIFNILWYILSLLVNMNVLPKPTEIYFGRNPLYEDKLYLHIGASLYRIFAALSLSLVLGLIIGLLMAYSSPCSKILNPLVYFTYPIPKTALLPVVMLVFGLGNDSKIILLVFILIFHTIISVRDGVLNISAETLYPLKSLGASNLQLFKHVLFPAILPELLTNTRLSIGTALSILFFAEAYGTSYGIGYYILDAWTRINYIDMYTGILAISLLGFFLFFTIDVIEEKTCKWKTKDSQS
ncbi:MAG: ABC transporter permease [Thermotaleaceae bacterium]